MITRLTKIQLIIFAIVTLVGGTFVGGRYAKIDRLVVDRTFPVTVQLKDSGGLFEGSQVTYRGIGVGRVGKMTFKNQGVEARLDIENSAPKIPSDILAVVANKSAVGEQFMDLQPRNDSAPYLKAGSQVSEANTQIPIQTSKLLLDVNGLVKSVNTESLKTVVDELGTAFNGTGEDLGTIIDTSTAFIKTAGDNIDTTRALIRDSNSVLQTQIDTQGDLATFSKNLALLSDTLVESDPDLRRLLDKGAPAAKELNQVVSENSKDLSTIINNVITANRPAYENSQAVRALFILYPYIVEGAPSTLIRNPDGTYDVAFGLVTGLPIPPPGNMEPAVCKDGYRDDRRGGSKIEEREFDLNADCVDPKLVPRNPGKTKVDHNRPAAASADAAGLGKDSWKWLLLGPAVTK